MCTSEFGPARAISIEVQHLLVLTRDEQLAQHKIETQNKLKKAKLVSSSHCCNTNNIRTICWRFSGY